MLSEKLSVFLGFLRAVIKDYNYYSSQLADAEKKECDLLHYLEFSSGYRQRDCHPT